MAKNFLNFDKMITPTIIKIVFWIGVALCLLSGIGMIITGLNPYFGGGAQIFMGLLTIAFGPFIVRIYCELLIIFFKMNESLQEIKEQLAGQQQPPQNIE